MVLYPARVFSVLRRLRLFLSFAIPVLMLEAALPAQQGAATSSPKSVANFVDVAQKAGLMMKNVFGGVDTKKYIIETTGTGVAIFDYDNDGLPDIFFVQGDRLKSDATLTPHLYHNLGGLRFEDVTAKAGIGHTGWGQGVCAGDADNDGYVDLFLTQ